MLFGVALNGVFRYIEPGRQDTMRRLVGQSNLYLVAFGVLANLAYVFWQFDLHFFRTGAVPRPD